jgi:sialate O-acetylesterase
MAFKGWRLGLLLVVTAAAQASVKPASIFGDHMVLQRGMPVPVWGTADPGEPVTVSFAGQTRTTNAGADGKWIVRLHPLRASVAGRSLIISGVEITDVLVGEVWLCSGQSNMELIPEKGLLNPEEEIAKARWPNIRLNLIQQAVSGRPLTDLKGSWTGTTPETMRKFSAAAYFFARQVFQKLQVPVGLVGAYYGGSNAQAWTRREVFQADPDLQIYLTEWEAGSARPAAPPRPTPPATPAGTDQRPNSSRENSRYRPSNFYNGMIAPMIPFAIRGVLWYQGEANTANARDAGLYARLFPAMIQDWRRQWGQGDFPFLFVQLPTSEPRYPEPTDSAWARVRESQQKALSLKQTAMIVTLDIGEGAVVHAHNKKQVGARLAATALNKVYGRRDVPDRYPLFERLELGGGKATVHLSHTGGRLVCLPAGQCKGIAMAGADRNFVWADAVVQGSSVVVSSPKVPQPVAVRYAWADNPEASLFNQAGFPAAPFRTDDWPAVKISNPRASP